MVNHRELSLKIRAGDHDAIMMGFNNEAGLHRAQAIISCVNHRFYDTAVEKQLLKLEEDDLVISGYRISDFAKAALVKLGGYNYSGSDSGIKTLIASDTWFN